MAVLNEDFRDMLRALHQTGAAYLVVGAHALALHGVVRATGDLDILIDPTPDNARRVMQALEAFGAPMADHGVTVSDLTAPGTVYQIGLPPRRIDLLTRITGLDFAEAWASAIRVEMQGIPVPFLGRAALIQNKLATGRAKDRLDAELLQPAGDAT